MRNSNSESGLNNQRGFNLVQLMVAIAIVSILTGLSIKPFSSFIRRIKLQNAADNLKHYILNARVRAISNSQRHCGIVIRINTAPKNDSIFAFLDKSPPDNVYTKGVDSLYGAPYVINKKKQGLLLTVPTPFPTTFVFRGDGSANTSAKILLTSGNFKDTLNVLASTGRVKVIVK